MEKDNNIEPIKPENFTRLDNPPEVLEFMKRVGAEHKGRKNPRPRYFYKGFYKEKPQQCEIIGHDGEEAVVIRLESGELHCIHPKYLVEMQSKKFGRE